MTRRTKGARFSRRSLVLGFVVLGSVVGLTTGAYIAARPNFLVTRGELEAAAPRMLRVAGSFEPPTPCEHGVVCRARVCRQAGETEPFAYRSVCFTGRAGHFTAVFSNATGNNYRAQDGVFYRPDNISPDPGGVCTRHVFGRWWEFAPLHDPDCPRGFEHYTGEG